MDGAGGSNRFSDPARSYSIFDQSEQRFTTLIPTSLLFTKQSKLNKSTHSTYKSTLRGKAQLCGGEEKEYYYFVRDRFNDLADPLDFLFLNRSCFNGMMRFNKKGRFNVPFCRKPDRFRKAYVTKIANQVAWVSTQMRGNDWTFRVQDWRPSLAVAELGDFIYLDPSLCWTTYGLL